MLKIVVTDVNVPCIGNMVQGERTHQLRNSCTNSNSCYTLSQSSERVSPRNRPNRPKPISCTQLHHPPSGDARNVARKTVQGRKLNPRFEPSEKCLPLHSRFGH